MERNDIKTKLREGIERFINVKETSKSPEGQSDNSPEGKHDVKQEPQGKKDYADVRRAFEKLGGPSMVDVMKLTGTEDDEKGVNRSLFRKKVKQIKNPDTGSFYQFDDKELASVRAALDIEK
jgi:hypothetical protein